MATIIDPLTSTTEPYGSLTTLPTQVGLFKGVGVRQKGSIKICFPATPKVIDMRRSANYDVQKHWYSPDGFSQYQYTEPFKLEVSFKLHHLDCTQGALSLIKLAASFEALVAPISTLGLNTTPASTPAQSNSEGAVDRGSSNVPLTPTNMKQLNVQPPVTCWLNLMSSGNNMPGISCLGYIENVRACLLAPFMLMSTGEFNLPSAGEFSFTFFHSPGYSNSTSGAGGSQAGTQAYADDINNKLFNSLNLLTSPNGYQTTGLSSN